MKATTAEHKPTHSPPLRERLRVWYQNWKVRKTSRAVRTLCKALQDDPDFARGWHANISMTILDATSAKCECKGETCHDEGCPAIGELPACIRAMETNRIADRLMSHLFGVKKP